MLDILLQVAIQRAAARQLVRGVGEYARRHGPWRIDFDERPSAQSLKSRDLSSFDGIIFDGHNAELTAVVRQSGLPAVAVATPNPLEGIPTVVSDHEGVGRMAAEHLLDRGLTQFGYARLRPSEFSHPRGKAFVRAVERQGYPCERFEPPADVAHGHEALEAWLWALPKPVGILAEEDRRALTIIRTAGRCGLRVPEQVAVIGVNNEELFAELSWPTITSIDHGAERIGRDAAGLLERMIRGEQVPRVLIVPPVRVVERHSTDILAVDDADLAGALRLIRREAAEGLSVEQVLEQVAVSRTTLENRFKAVLGRTIFAEITRVRIERVKTLLRTTDLGLADIAARTGFRYVSHLSKAFRKAAGQTPTQYRRR